MQIKGSFFREKPQESVFFPAMYAKVTNYLKAKNGVNNSTFLG
jgi:hypothetical protein